MHIPGLTRRLRRRHEAAYEPESYWEGRAAELVKVYDRPESWDERGWMRGGVEEDVVPELLRAHGVEDVIVAGAGSGRQYGYLGTAGVRARGFDISPSLVAVCRERYPEIETRTGSVVDAEEYETPADAVVTSAVLQHVAPAEIERAVDALRSLARKIVIIRELTYLDAESPYQFAHDYDALFQGWTQVHRETTDERKAVRVELMAWVPGENEG